jgi:arylsulfatase A-like enzyme
MRRLSIIAFTISLLFAKNFHLATAEPNRSPPNIVFILADDLGINDLGCYGRQDHRTPNLDHLASQGMKFTQAYAQPLCSPTRATLLTGKNNARLQITTYLPGRSDCVAQKVLHPKIKQHLPLSEKTLGECLKSLGYATGYVGKWHLGGAGFLPTNQGFDLYHPGKENTKPSATEGGKGEYGLTAAAIQFVETNRDRPFLLYLSHNNPHIPYTAAAERIANNRDAFEPTYAAVIETLDDAIGRLLAKLDELKLAENTVVVFMSDNGGLHVPEGPHPKTTHNTPFRAGKGYLYEGGIRVPLIVRWPGQVPAGRVVDTPVTSYDVLPTLVQIAGGQPPADLDGVSLVPLLTSKGKFADRSLFWHMPHYSNQGGRPGGAVRQADWKLIEWYDSDTVELYNLADDRNETTNLADQQPERATELRRQLDDWRKKTNAQNNRPNPKFDATQFNALYIDVDPSRYDPATAKPDEFKRMQNWQQGMVTARRQGQQPTPD